jgi:hypothetical protein
MNSSQGTNPFGQQYAAQGAGALSADEAFGMNREMVDKNIKTAWIAAVVSAVLTTVAWGAAMAGVPELAGFQYAWVDIVIIAALAFGVFRRSRTAATLLVAYWLFNIAVMGVSGAIAVRVVFLVVFIQGARAAYAHHKLVEQQPATSGIVNQILN